MYGLGVVLVAMILTITGLPVQAEEYSSEITPEMELAGMEGESDSEASTSDNSDRVMITDTSMYDRQLGTYIYSTGEGYIYANVLDGMITRDSVTITADSGIDFTIYKDGDAVSLTDKNTVKGTGSYTVVYSKSGSKTDILSFTIVGKSIREPESYDLPTGCIASSVTLDNEKVSVSDRSIDLSKEGDYHIEYLCVRNNISYTLDVNVDHTAPTLKFKGLNDSNKVRGAVTIQDYEKGATLTIQKDGSNISARKELTQAGAYTVRIADEAGNASIYSFYILFYLNTGGIIFVILLIVALIALAVYLYISRKKLRVR